MGLITICSDLVLLHSMWVLTSPLPPRPFTPAGVKGSLKSRFGGLAPAAEFGACGCGARLLANVGSRGGRRVDAEFSCASTASASAATRDTTQRACNVRASERARAPRLHTPLERAEQRSGGRIRAGACLSVASLRQTPHPASSARHPAGARSTARLLFAYFLLAKQEKVSRPPGRNPASHESQTFSTKSPKC